MASLGFWSGYIKTRPSPSAGFFDLINEYHAAHSDGRTAVAHDVGTGPGNIAQRLLSHYDHVVGSDINDSALAAATPMASREDQNRLTFVHAPAEELATAPIPSALGVGNTDLVVASECMPLLDAPRALQAFHTLLRPHGTLAIYFYGRPIFVDDDAEELNAAYENLATHAFRCLLPIKDTPGFPISQRGLEGLVSGLDNIAVPASDWEAVQRYKWNFHHPLLYHNGDAFDFTPAPVDRRGPHEMEERSVVDLGFWAEDWDADRIEQFVLSVYPGVRDKAVYPGFRDKAGGPRYKELQELVDDLRKRMCVGGGLGGKRGTRKVTFPVVLILATRK